MVDAQSRVHGRAAELAEMRTDEARRDASSPHSSPRRARARSRSRARGSPTGAHRPRPRGARGGRRRSSRRAGPSRPLDRGRECIVPGQAAVVPDLVALERLGGDDRDPLDARVPDSPTTWSSSERIRSARSSGRAPRRGGSSPGRALSGGRGRGRPRLDPTFGAYPHRVLDRPFEELGAAPVGRLATVDRDGRPHVVPICFVLDGETLYTAVDEKPKRTRRLKRLENIEANPQVEVLSTTTRTTGRGSGGCGCAGGRGSSRIRRRWLCLPASTRSTASAARGPRDRGHIEERSEWTSSPS